MEDIPNSLNEMFDRAFNIILDDDSCEWKLDKAGDYYESNCNDFYRKNIIDDYLGGKYYCKFCPNCGKRIKYIK